MTLACLHCGSRLVSTISPGNQLVRVRCNSCGRESLIPRDQTERIAHKGENLPDGFLTRLELADPSDRTIQDVIQMMNEVPDFVDPPYRTREEWIAKFYEPIYGKARADELRRRLFGGE